MEIISTIVISVITAAVTTLTIRGVPFLIAKWVERRKYAFTLKLGIGEIWHLKKLHPPIATDFHYRIVDRSLNDKKLVLTHTEIDPKVPGYGIWYLDPRDTLEIYWTEKTHQYSTSVVIHDAEREYKLRRENTGH